MRLTFLSVIFSSLAILSSSSWASLTSILAKEVPPFCSLTKETKFLKKKFVIRHLKNCKGEKSYLYLDNHTVRTMNQVLMIEIAGETVKDVRVLKFFEPSEYKASQSWIAKLKGRKGPRIKMGQSLDAITGATLTSHAIVDNVAKVLKIHQNLRDGTKN